jgi:hypothetical protein
MFNGGYSMQPRCNLGTNKIRATIMEYIAVNSNYLEIGPTYREGSYASDKVVLSFNALVWVFCSRGISIS